jgi:hypothetical protein
MAVVTNFSPDKLAIGPGLIWYNVAVPGAGARLAIDSDGKPTVASSPNAKHIGYTAAGAKFSVKPEIQRHFADEEVNPVHQSITQSVATISADVQLLDDFDVLELLSSGVGTRVTGDGFDSITGGIAELRYTSIAVIFALKDDPTKFGVFHLYNAANEGGFEVALSRKSLSQSNVVFTGLALQGRAPTDTSWNRWSMREVE